MLFNSSEYILFLPLVLGVYLLLGAKHLRAQNAWLLLASYVFYGWWDWRFLALLFGTTLNDYLCAIGMMRFERRSQRRALLTASIVVNLGVLGFFKYYNFFVSSFIEAFARIGIELHSPTLKVILPVGISFYTFQALTYTISVYRGTVQPTRDPVAFFAYVAFFPQLVAGPIERAGHLLPQFLKPRTIRAQDMADGLRQMTWGFFCKLVVADNCAVVVNSLFEQPAPLAGSVVLVAALCFAFQIYADFSGYSHIAIGTARLFGFELMQNFATPYFSQSVPEFWRRWHISLSTWFRDYVYIPLGGNRDGKLRQAANLMATFMLSGLWHGANWTFVIWGFLHGLYSVPRVFIGEPLARLAQSANAFVRVPTVLFRVGLTFTLVLIAWIFFRARDVGTAFNLIGQLLSPSLFSSPLAALRGFELMGTLGYAGVGCAVLLSLEWLQRGKPHALSFDDQTPLLRRWPAYVGIAALVLLLRYTGESLDFIYFQF
jgi:alginate O-acetyltransferase complex protein AlgI